MNEAIMEKEDNGEAHISLVMALEQTGEFFPVLQQGFGVMASVPCTIKNLLCDQFGLGLTYVTERITTIFLDGKPTDSMDEALVRDLSTIALSAAMPGVVGATMRRGSYYASMRNAITSMDKEKAGTCREGMIWVKLFNLLLDDLGAEFLKRGIIISPRVLADFFLHKPDSFWEGCKEALINGKPVAPENLKQGDSFSHFKTIGLSVAFT